MSGRPPEGHHRAVWRRSWPASGRPPEAIAPALRAGAALRWCVVALVASAAATAPPRLPALAVGWLVLVSFYNLVVQSAHDVLKGRHAHRVAQVQVVADAAAMLALAGMYEGLPPAELNAGFFLVLLEALIWCRGQGLILSIGLLGSGWAATDIVRLGLLHAGFDWRDFLSDLMAAGLVAVALLLAYRVLSGEAHCPTATADDAKEAGLRIGLSDREKEVLALISLGCSNRMIATRLHVAPSTVKSHVESILARLHARNRAQAVAIAGRLHLLPDAGVRENGDAGLQANPRAGAPPPTGLAPRTRVRPA